MKEMKEQWRLILALIVVIIIAIFAIVNVEEVPVNFIIGEARWPLILVILGSALLGVIISSCFAGIRIFRMRKEIRELENLIPNNHKIKKTRKEEAKIEAVRKEQQRIKLERKEATKKAETENEIIRQNNE
nr:LapA family protein [Lysinibacillus timonensis]